MDTWVAMQCDACICVEVFGVAGVFLVARYGRATAIPLNRHTIAALCYTTLDGIALGCVALLP